MEIVNVDISKITPYVNNPRHNEAAIDKVAASIKEFGFKVPMVIDRENIIVTGHTRFAAAQKIGLKAVPCVIADDLTPAQVKAFRLADNKVSELAEWDNEKLSIEMEELNDLDFDVDLENFGFSGIEEDAAEIERTDMSEKIKERFDVVISCKNEEELEKVYNDLTAEGYECQISTS